MTTLADLTMAQFATAYGTLTGTPASPKSCNGKARWQARIEALMAEKKLTLTDVLAAAGIEPPAAAPLDVTLEQDVAAAEATFITPAAEPVPDTADDDTPLDAATILASEQVFNDVRDLLHRYLTGTAGLEDQSAMDAALRAVDALPPPAPVARRTREGTKQDVLIAMLRRPEGATIPELAETLGWAPHSVRGAIAAGLKKRLGLDVVSEKVAEGPRRYRIPATA